MKDSLFILFYKVKSLYNLIKYTFQKITRRHHTSDMELWNLHVHLARILYPKIKAFSEMEQHGYPADFVEYTEEEWNSKEEYNKAIEEGKIIGGGPEKWEEIQREILFAFEYLLHSEYEKNMKDFYERWNIKDPHEEIEENLNFSYWYENNEGHTVITGEPVPEEEMKEKGYTFKKQDSIYYNVQLEREHAERAQRGFELFGKYFMNLWD